MAPGDTDAPPAFIDVVDVRLTECGVRVLLECVDAGLEEPRLQDVVVGSPLEVSPARQFEAPIVVWMSAEVFGMADIANARIAGCEPRQISAVPSVDALSQMTSSKSVNVWAEDGVMASAR